MARKIWRHGCVTVGVDDGTKGREQPAEWNICECSTLKRCNQGSHRKKVVRPSRRREMAKIAVCNERLSIRAACAAFTISETCYCYQAKLSDENPEIDNWLEVLYGRHRNWGFKLCFLYLHNVKGFGWNHKCVYRNYCELALNLLIKLKKFLYWEMQEPL